MMYFSEKHRAQPKWRERLTVAAQVAGIIAAIAAVTIASLMVANWVSAKPPAPVAQVETPPAP